jgi:hypothetical protein
VKTALDFLQVGAGLDNLVPNEVLVMFWQESDLAQIMESSGNIWVHLVVVRFDELPGQFSFHISLKCVAEDRSQFFLAAKTDLDGEP